MDKRCRILIIAVLSLAILSLCLTIPPSSGAQDFSLQVEIRDQYTKVPIFGATVEIIGAANRTAVTNSTGIVIFSGIPSGTYILNATSPCYPSVTHFVEVNGKTTTVVVFGYTRASFTYSPEKPPVNSTMSFNASLSTSSGPIMDYAWDFGDGAIGSGVQPTHVYSNVGSYTVKLTVTSAVGEAIYTRLVQVVSPNENNLYWVLLIIPFFIIIPLLLWRRRRYYVVIQARVPFRPTHPHCPGDGTKCEDCKLTPC